MKKYFISISGNIGSGKTSLASLLSHKFGWKPFFESVEDNPYLKDFYGDMKKWAFQLQIYFLSKRFNDYQYIFNNHSSVILDRTIFEDGEIFAKNLYELGNMDNRDWENYRNLYDILIKYLQPVDLMIYLRSDVDFLYERIMQRNRNFETTISKDYLARLNKSYEEWISGYDFSDLLIVDVRKLDFVNNEKDFNIIIDMMREKIKF
jgi:deoxyadenosine/deoxycytidine kinase